MKKNKIRVLLSLIFIMVFAIGLSQPSLLEAAIASTSYDFGEVLVDSTRMLALSINNLEDTSTTITGLELAQTDCSDFSVVATPESMTIPANGTIYVAIGFTPSSIGTCSDTLRVYVNSPLPYLVTLAGTGIEAESAQPEAAIGNQEDSNVGNEDDSAASNEDESTMSNEDDGSVDQNGWDSRSSHRFHVRDHRPKDARDTFKRRPYLAQIEEIKSFMQANVKNGNLKGVGKGRRADKGLEALQKMLVVTSQLIEKGKIEAARNKLIEIYKKTDGKSRPKDFVEDGIIKKEFASKIQQLTEQMNIN